MNRLELRFSALLENVAFARTSVASFISSLNPTIDEIQEVKTIVQKLNKVDQMEFIQDYIKKSYYR